MEFSIRKIQILADKETGHPIFYCHSEDQDHAPTLLISREIERGQSFVVVRARRVLYKVKYNPQRKNRVDIYMSIAQANLIGNALSSAASDVPASGFRTSRASPAENASGNMKLPNIVWSMSGRHSGVRAQIDTGTLFRERDSGYIYVDLEYPDESHIKMKEHEVHIGIDLSVPIAVRAVAKPMVVHVPEAELQRGRGEKNPLYKTVGDILVKIAPASASDLGEILKNVIQPPV